MKLDHQYRETYEYEKGFADYYAKHIVPLGKQLDLARENVKSKGLKNKLFAVIFIIACIAIVIFETAQYIPRKQMHNFVELLIIVIPLACWVLFVRRPNKKYFSAAKAQIVPLLLNFLGNLKYKVKGEINLKKIRKHIIFPTNAIFHPIDYIYGRYNDVDLEISKVEVTDTSGVIFNGILILMNMATPFSGRVIIKPASSSFKFWEVFRAKIRGIKFCKTDNDLFDRKFAVYTSSGDYAKTLLTKSFQTQLIELDTVFGSAGLKCSYMESSLLIAISTYKMPFEPGDLETSTINPENIKRMLKEVKSVLDVVDKLSAQPQN